MAKTNINIRTDSELKGRAQMILNDLGLDITTAINMYLKQIVYKESIPFSIDRTLRKTTKTERRALRGSMSGKVWMSGDFDAPLEEMQDYS